MSRREIPDHSDGGSEHRCGEYGVRRIARIEPLTGNSRALQWLLSKLSGFKAPQMAVAVIKLMYTYGVKFKFEALVDALGGSP
jgi:hypothetical protein